MCEDGNGMGACERRMHGNVIGCRMVPHGNPDKVLYVHRWRELTRLCLSYTGPHRHPPLIRPP